jgi:hypothetical protein
VRDQQYRSLAVEKASVERKIDNVTEGLPRQVSKKLRSVKNHENIIEIADYKLRYGNEN